MKKISLNTALVLLGRIILGGILIYASFDKIAEPAQFAKDIRNYAIPTMGLSNLMAMILPWLELITGLALILGIMVDGAALITALMMGMFVVAIGQAMLRGISIECGCGLIEGEMVGIRKLVEDIIYFIFALIILRRKENRFEIVSKSG